MVVYHRHRAGEGAAAAAALVQGAKGTSYSLTHSFGYSRREAAEETKEGAVSKRTNLRQFSPSNELAIGEKADCLTTQSPTDDVSPGNTASQ